MMGNSVSKIITTNHHKKIYRNKKILLEKQKMKIKSWVFNLSVASAER